MQEPILLPSVTIIDLHVASLFQCTMHQHQKKSKHAIIRIKNCINSLINALEIKHGKEKGQLKASLFNFKKN